MPGAGAEQQQDEQPDEQRGHGGDRLRTPFALKVPSKPLEVTLNKFGEILARPVRRAR